MDLGAKLKSCQDARRVNGVVLSKVMPFSYAELEQFYEKLVARAHSRGIACAITSGMACVAFGVSNATKDCDLLCTPDSAGDLLGLLGETALRRTSAQLPRKSYCAAGCALVPRRMDESFRLATRGFGRIS